MLALGIGQEGHPNVAAHRGERELDAAKECDIWTTNVIQAEPKGGRGTL